MREEWTLSRILITGFLSRQTPHCVIEEVAQAHGIVIENARLAMPDYKKQVLEFINHSQPLILCEPLTSKDYGLLARYINPQKSVQWAKADLRTAFDFLSRFQFHRSVSKQHLPPNFEWGWQTPDNPQRLNACVLYGICKQQDFHVQATTTTDQMAWAVKWWLMGDDAIHSFSYTLLQSFQPQDLIDLMVLGTGVHPQRLKSQIKIQEQSLNRQSLNHDVLQSCFDRYGDRREILRLISPQSASEAIALAAMVFKKDISLATYPLTEYLYLRNNPSLYTPLDPQLKRIHLLHPKLLDLTKTFNPAFPASYYDDSDLKKMALEEGYKSHELASQSPYELLQFSYLLENFYPGIYPEIVNEETPITLDQVNEMDPHMIICYGLRGSRLTAFHISGLIEHFQMTKGPGHPLDARSTIGERAMAKLKWMAQRTDAGGSAESQRERARLVKALREVELFADATLFKAKDFYYAYREASPSQRQQVRQCFSELLELAMYMRGWEGPPAQFPIREAPTFNQNAVDVRVTEALANFEKSCQDVGVFGRDLLQLPLLKYQGDFIASNSSSDGYTIQDRLRIVKMGNETGNMASCIRLTSNWLAATSYRYLTMIGVPEPFAVEELRYIS
jgi:hypothetical protein